MDYVLAMAYEYMTVWLAKKRTKQTHVPWTTNPSLLDEHLLKLNQLGKEGWRVISVQEQVGLNEVPKEDLKKGLLGAFGSVSEHDGYIVFLERLL